MSLAEYNPESFLYFGWGYSFKEILKFYKAKQKEYYDKRSADYEFLVSLASAALGGKSSEKSADSMGSDDGSGIESMELVDFNNLKKCLGADFEKQFGAWEELP